MAADQELPEVSTNVDSPIRSGDEDNLGRAMFAQLVANRIRHSGNGPSVVFGLSGPWGSGKTSTLNMVVEALEEFEPAWAVTFFTPWSAADPYALLEEFYGAIASAMPRGKKGKKVRRLLAAAAPTGVAVAKVLGSGLINRFAGEGAAQEALEVALTAMADQAGEFAIVENPFTTRFDAISESIAKTGRNILVVVDDVDRLHGEELLSVMKAVRLLGRFDRVHYLLSYDSETVVDVLVETDLARGKRQRAAKYLEKIVQYPFELPPIQERHLVDELGNQLQEIASRYEMVFARETRGILSFDPDFAAESETAATVAFEHLPTATLTLRSIYRLCSQVDIMLALVGNNELDLVDAVLLTALRLEYPELYKHLPLWRRELTTTTRAEKDALTEWRSKVSEAAQIKKDSPKEVDAYRLLCSLFPSLPRIGYDYAPNETERQIRSVEYFDRYFAFTIPDSDISDVEVRRELEYLAAHGQLPPNSLTAQYMGVPRMRRRLYGKVIRNLDTVDGAHWKSAKSAAHTLTRTIDWERPHQLRRSRWDRVVSAFLWRAVSTAPSEPEATGVIDGYLDEFSLDILVDVLALEIPNGDSASPMRRACERVFREVHDEFIWNLFEQEPDALQSRTVWTHWRYLERDSYLREKIVQTARQRLALGGVDVIDVAARFVTIGRRTSDELPCLEAFDLGTFEMFIERIAWVDQVPVLDEQVDPVDLSFENRRRYAAAHLRQTIASAN